VAGHVEFLSGDSDESDEPAQPPQPPERRYAPLYRIGAVAIALSALVVWGLTRPDGAHQSVARPLPTPYPSPLFPSPTLPPQKPPPPSVIACQLGAPVANEIVTAMQHYLPTVRIDNLRAYRCVRGSGATGRIVFEAISGHVGRFNIDVEATLRTGDHAGVNASPRLGETAAHFVLLSRAEAVAAGLEVDVNAYGRAGEHPPVFAMRGLADFVSLNVIL
jgi:hypothetical protein